jgi:hypothetical protein
MSLLKNLRFSHVLRAAILVFIPLIGFSLAPRSPSWVCYTSLGIEDLMTSQDPFDRIVWGVTMHGLAKHAAQTGTLESRPFDVCLHPDTSPEDAERILRELPTYTGPNGLLGYWLRGRWSYTATDGNTGTTGDPITITWGIVPDGTWADGGASDLIADFDAEFGGVDWMSKMRNAFNLWEQAIGITYVEVSDDGANMPGSSGQLGVRGDVRIGGRSIDGPSNVLAYNYYPSAGGDMVLDTDDASFFSSPLFKYAHLKNTVTHEHGHGIGLGHVIPENCTKLMEAYHCGGSYYVGPQDDDIRGGMRDYGDPYENNDSNSDPTDLGSIPDTLIVENLSIDNGNTDVDWYLVTLPDAGMGVEVDPVGSTYMLGNEGGTASSVSTDSISDPDIDLYDATGTTLLASATSAGLGETEILTYIVPSAGDYQIKVYRKAGSGNGVQRYNMMVYTDDLAGVPFADGAFPGAGLAVSVYPNPSAAHTTARFYAPTVGPYTLEVFDVAGRLSRVIQGHAPSAGWTEVVWDGRDNRGSATASGVYFMRVRLGDRVETRRVLRIQ